MKPKIKYGDMEWETYCEIGEVEHTVVVYYDTYPAEPDVGWAGGLDINGIYLDGNDVSGRLSDSETEQLRMRVEEYENDRTDPDNDPRY